MIDAGEDWRQNGSVVLIGKVSKKKQKMGVEMVYGGVDWEEWEEWEMKNKGRWSRRENGS